MRMSEKKNITRATGILGLATTLSRIAGLVRDMVIAAIFGAGFATDAFFMAFTIPNLLRRFFAEGSLTAAFVPTFTELYHLKGREEAVRVAQVCMTLLLLVMTAVTLAGIAGSPWIVKGIGYGYGAIEGKLVLTDHLNRIMFPYIFLVSLLALITGVLNVFGHYFVPAVSPLLLNVSMIICALTLRPYFADPVTALAVGVVLGGVAQLLVQLPVLSRHDFPLRLNFQFGHAAVRRIARLMLPGIAGVAIYQINVVVTRLLGSFLPEGSVSYLYYGQRLFEFPQGIFVVSLAQAVLPSLSRQASAGDHDGFRDSLRFALVLIALVTVPATIGLVLCAEPMYSLFFMKGAFDAEAVRQTALALAAFAPGLFFVGVSRILVPGFYARKDTRTPVWISFWTLLVNLALGLALMGPLGHVGLALALTLSSMFNSVALFAALRKKFGPLGVGSAVASLLRIAPPALGMAWLVERILGSVDWQEAGQLWLKGGVLAAAVFTGMGVYAAGCYLCRVPQVSEAADLFKAKLLKKAGR